MGGINHYIKHHKLSVTESDIIFFNIHVTIQEHCWKIFLTSLRYRKNCEACQVQIQSIFSDNVHVLLLSCNQNQ